MNIKRKFLSALCIATCLFAVPGRVVGAERLQHPEIKGADDRLIVEANEYPWSAIGRVNRAGMGFCTGVLVGPKTVLTAAHCIYNKRTGKNFKADSLHFVAGYQRGDYLAHAKATGVEIAPGYKNGEKASLSQSAHDWAILTLAKPLGAVAGYLGVSLLSPKTLVALNKHRTVFVQAGYSKDRQHIISAHVNCELKGYAREAPVVVHLCDAISGDSGSPLFAYLNGSFSILAIHSATVRDVTPPLGIALPSQFFIKRMPKESQKGGRAPWRRTAGQAKSITQILELSPGNRTPSKGDVLGDLIQRLPAKRGEKIR